MNDSNSCFVKYEYSKLQYHWCSTAFNLITGLWISYIKNNSRRDGIAINTRVIVGSVVEIVSIICPPKMNRLVCLFWMILIIVYNTGVIIINRLKPTGYVMHQQFNTLWTGDADLRLYITTVQDGRRKSSFLTRA